MKKIKLLVIILLVILITMVAFFGVYTQVQNRMENKVKGYEYSMDLKGSRVVSLKVKQGNKQVIKDNEGKEVTDSENLTDEQIAEKGYVKEEIPYNSEETLNIENYKIAKKIIEKRLKSLKIEDYIIKLNEQNGEIYIELPENNDTDYVVGNLNTSGKFEISDSQTNEVLMNNDDIKLANVMYGSNSASATSTSGTNVYLNIEFNKEGAKKLENISNTYVKSENTQENTTNSENTTDEQVATENEDATSEENQEKKITMKLDEQEIISTSFDETLSTGKMQLSIGQASTEQDTLKEYVDQASSMATVLDTGRIPITYEIDKNEYILSDINVHELKSVFYIAISIIVIALIIVILHYKVNGLLSAIAYIGMLSLMLLLIRYTNVILSIEGMLGIALIAILEYIFINKLLKEISKKSKLDKEIINNTTKAIYKDFMIKIIPIIIASITFCFTKWTSNSSFGMIMFWGIVLIVIYNLLITINLLKINTEEK